MPASQTERPQDIRNALGEYNDDNKPVAELVREMAQRLQRSEEGIDRLIECAVTQAFVMLERTHTDAEL